MLGKLFDRFPGLRLAADPETLTYRDSTPNARPGKLPVYLEWPPKRSERPAR